MKKFDLPLILDIVFLFFAGLFISFTVLRYYLDSLSFVITISLLFSVMITAVGFKFMQKKHGSTILKKEELTKKKEAFFNLAFYNENELNSYFLKLFTKNGLKAENTKNGILLEEKGLIVKFAFKLTMLSCDDFVNIVKDTDKTVLLLTDTAQSDVFSYAKKINTKIVTGENLFLIMKKNELYPEIKFKLTAKEQIVKKRINIDLTRKKAKNFFVFGIMLLLFSFVVAFPIYYLIMGNLLIITSVILRFYGKQPENADSII